MANYASLSLKQVKALHKFLSKNMGDSVDGLVKEIGEEDAFVLVLLKQRLGKKIAETD